VPAVAGSALCGAKTGNQQMLPITQTLHQRAVTSGACGVGCRHGISPVTRPTARDPHMRVL
jgi:hypothetical protein